MWLTSAQVVQIVMSFPPDPVPPTINFPPPNISSIAGHGGPRVDAAVRERVCVLEREREQREKEQSYVKAVQMD